MFFKGVAEIPALLVYLHSGSLTQSGFTGLAAAVNHLGIALDFRTDSTDGSHGGGG